MYKLDETIYFYVLLLIPVFILLYWFRKIWRKKISKKINLLSKIANNRSIFKPLLKLIVFLVAIFFIILGLVNPKIGIKLETVKRKGVDVVFAIDVSKSMLADDIAPNRLEKAKQVVSKLIDNLASDRVGIIVYAGSAYPLLPITTDHAAAKMFLQTAHPDMVSSHGTSIAEALNLANTYYDNEEQTNKFLVLISDGDDHEENIESATSAIVQNGVKIYTVGVGTEKGGFIPIIENGNKIFKKDNKGEVVITQRNIDILKEISDNGQGEFFDGNITIESVNSLSEIIRNSEKKEFETKQFSDFKDQFQWFLVIGLLLLVADLFLFDKKTKWVKKANLFNEK